MNTETVEEVVAAPPSCHNNDLSPIAKGKRTKRHRLHSPPIAFSIKPAGVFGTTTNNNKNHPLYPTSSEESATTEEEDTARCLILLAQGHFSIHSQNHDDAKRKRPEETASAACMYACKTCNRTFSSFQALGGHRASHKKPKNEKKSALVFSDEEDFPSPVSSKKRMGPPSSIQLANISAANAAAAAAAGTGGPKPLPSPRIHECSYCGAEFTSGQALGGHMRRHRAGPVSPPFNPAVDSVEGLGPEEPRKPRSGLPLDLNLPAPEDENQRFGFAARQQRSPEKLALSTTNTPTLVDCHY